MQYAWELKPHRNDVQFIQGLSQRRAVNTKRFEIIFTLMVVLLESYSWMNIMVILLLRKFHKKPFDCSGIPQLMISWGHGERDIRLCSLCCWNGKRFLINHLNGTGPLLWPSYFLDLMDTPLLRFKRRKWCDDVQCVSETFQLCLTCQIAKPHRFLKLFFALLTNRLALILCCARFKGISA